MQEKNKYILKKSVSDLPVYKANEEVWERLNGTMEKNASNFRKAIDTLPGYQAPEVVWGSINPGLNNRQSLLTRHIRMIKLAAAFIILLGIGTTLIYLVNRQSTRFQNPVSAETGLEDPLIYSPALCEGNPGVCQSPVFIELDNQLTEVKEELILMQPLVENKDPQMLKYYYRLENLRVEIEKKMVKLIIES